MSLREAQEAKLDRACRKLELRPDDHVVEIGTGWGSFALHAARQLRLPRDHDDDLRASSTRWRPRGCATPGSTTASRSC